MKPGYCQRGHKLTPENSVVNNQGTRHCRLCAEIRRMRDKRGTRQPKFRHTKPAKVVLPDPNPTGGPQKGKPGVGPFNYDFDLASLAAWQDDPFALVNDETQQVLAEIRAGREISASYVDRLP